MSVLKRFTAVDFRPGDMIVRETPSLCWLILEVEIVPPAQIQYIAIDANIKGSPPFTMIISRVYQWPLQFKLLRKDE
jgi:hypothetical protein